MNARVQIDKDMASKLWSEGKSIIEIAGRFGISRCTMSGIMNRDRQRFPKRGDDAKAASQGYRLDVKQNTKRVNLGNIHRARIEAARREAAEFQSGTSAYLQIAPDDALRLENGKELMDLDAHDCRWPVNSGGPFRFCAAKQFSGSSYCAHHMLRSMPKEAAGS